jgi:uncharacterized protein
MIKAETLDTRPWYKEPWPWLLMSGPAIVVVAGFITLYLAASGQDGLVVDDYYKQGKTINQSLHRDDIARQIGISATVSFDQVNDRLNVTLSRTDGKLLPAAISVAMVHATRSGADKIINLTQSADGYVGKLPALAVGKWNVLIDDAQKQWRLQKEIMVDSAPIPLLQIKPQG